MKQIFFCLICKRRSRIRQALQGKTKSSRTKDIVGIDIETYRKWTKSHFTPEMPWDNIELDHVKPICTFNISNDEELGDAFSWKNTQPLLKHDRHLKGTKFNFLEYQPQFIKTYQFLKINEEGYNENIH